MHELIKIANGKRRVIPDFGYNFIDARDLSRTAISAVEHGKAGQNYLVGGEYCMFLKISEFISETERMGRAGLLHHWVMIRPWDNSTLGLIGFDRVTRSGQATWNLGYWVRSSEQNHGIASKSIAGKSIAGKSIARQSIFSGKSYTPTKG